MLHYKNKARLLMIPGLTGFLLFYIIPFFWSFVYALTNNPLQLKFIGLGKFRELLHNRYYLLALRNTLTFTGIGVVLMMLFSTAVSVLLVNANRRYAVLKAALLFPYFCPQAAQL